MSQDLFKLVDIMLVLAVNRRQWTVDTRATRRQAADDQAAVSGVIYWPSVGGTLQLHLSNQ